MHKIVVLFACIGAVLCNDLEVGTKSGRILFDEKIEASPAIWKQTQNVTINATEHEVISCIKVTDERENKDGSARIVEGGEGQKNVTIELQSPAVFRGFTFHVVVYAVQENDQQQIVQHPISITNDTEVNQATTKGSQITDSVPTVPSTPEKPVEEKIPMNSGNQDRKNRDTQDVMDPIVDYVNEKKAAIERQTIKPELTTPHVPEIKDLFHPHDLTKDIHDISDKVTTEQVSTTGQTETSITDVTTGSTDSLTTKINEYTQQTESPATKVADQHEYDSISQAIGQKVIYGIKQN